MVQTIKKAHTSLQECTYLRSLTPGRLRKHGPAPVPKTFKAKDMCVSGPKVHLQKENRGKFVQTASVTDASMYPRSDQAYATNTNLCLKSSPRKYRIFVCSSSTSNNDLGVQSPLAAKHTAEWRAFSGGRTQKNPIAMYSSGDTDIVHGMSGTLKTENNV